MYCHRNDCVIIRLAPRMADDDGGTVTNGFEALALPYRGFLDAKESLLALLFTAVGNEQLRALLEIAPHEQITNARPGGPGKQMRQPSLVRN